MPRKSKDVSYRDEDDGEESEEETTNLTLTQKQELAEKIQVADGDTLTKAIEIIQQSTNLGAVSGIAIPPSETFS
jgi:bromodomain-containing factor 1